MLILTAAILRTSFFKNMMNLKWYILVRSNIMQTLLYIICPFLVIIAPQICVARSAAPCTNLWNLIYCFRDLWYFNVIILIIAITLTALYFYTFEDGSVDILYLLYMTVIYLLRLTAKNNCYVEPFNSIQGDLLLEKFQVLSCWSIN